MRYALEILIPILPPLRFGSFTENWQNTTKSAKQIIKIAKEEMSSIEPIKGLGSYQVFLTSVRIKKFDAEQARRSFVSKINRVSRSEKHTYIISDLVVGFNLELETDAKGVEFNQTVSEGQYKKAKLDGEEYVKLLSDEIFRDCMSMVEGIYI